MGKIVLAVIIFQLYLPVYAVYLQNVSQVSHCAVLQNQKPVSDYLKDYLSYSFWASPMLNNSKCEQDINLILREAENFNLWALKMIDASAKLPSGILSGNLNQYGDFDECLSVNDRHHQINSKYCLATIDAKVSNEELTTDKIRIIDDYVHSHRLLTNELFDQGHRVPKMETFNWGLCIPSSCSNKDVEKLAGNVLKRIFYSNPFRYNVTVNDEVCYVAEEKKETSMASLIVKVLFTLLLVLTLLEFFIDVDNFKVGNSNVIKIIKCFSIKKNWEILTNTNPVNDDLECLHGARFLNAVGLLLSHKQMAMLFVPTFNRTAMGKAFSKLWTMLGRSAILYTDSFIMISGILVSYSFVKDLDKTKKLNFKEKLSNRIIRFLPNLVGIILFCTFIMENMSTGPLWGLVVTKYSNLCKKYMWRNFLFVHNYFGFENMCLTHTHQLGIDMQLFIVSPVFIYMLWKSPKLGTMILLFSSALSTWLRYEVTKKENISTLIYYGVSVEQLWKTANLSYILPTHRLTVYLLGILLGYYLRRKGRNLKFNRLQSTIGWFLATSSGVIAMFGFYKAAYKEYTYNPTDSAIYNAFAPILWTAFLGWGILACLNDSGGFFNKFLSWKYFKIFTKISYAFYLTQFPVFFYNVGTQRTVQFFKGFQSLFEVKELSVILLTSFALTLLIDIPFQNIKKSLVNSKKSFEKKVALKEKNDVDDSENNSKNHKTRRKVQTHGT